MKAFSCEKRFRKTALIAGIFLLSAFSVQIPVFSAEVFSSRELIEDAKEFDGQLVHYRGEAVVAVLKRGEHSWLTLNDGDNAIGVWCKTRQIAGVKFIGNYKARGDIVEVEGIFHRSCPIHGGELDIHAGKVIIVKQGFVVKETVSAERLSLAIVLFLVILLAVIMFRKRL